MHKDRVLVTLAGLVGMMGVRAAEADCVRLPNTGLQASFRAPWTLSDEYKPWVLPGGDEYDDEEGIEGAIGAFVGDADVITGELSWVYVRVTTGDASTCTPRW